MAGKDEFKELRKAALAAGWTITTSRNGHLRWTSPNGGMPIFSASTPSDNRAVKNHCALLRRAGLNV